MIKRRVGNSRWNGSLAPIETAGQTPIPFSKCSCTRIFMNIYYFLFLPSYVFVLNPSSFIIIIIFFLLLFFSIFSSFFYDRMVIIIAGWPLYIRELCTVRIGRVLPWLSFYLWKTTAFFLKKRRSVVVVEVKKGGTQTREYSIMVVITVPSCRGGGGIEQQQKNEGISTEESKRAEFPCEHDALSYVTL